MRYDMIIVGAGSAGTILATRFSEDSGRSVLLLEAGPDYPDFEQLPPELKFGYDTIPNSGVLRTPGGHPITLTTDKHNWQFVARATAKAPPMPVPRGKVTGGSSAINYSGFYRGLPEDFDAWASFGNDQWSFGKVLPYFRKIETDVDFHDDYHGTDGPIFVHHSNPENWHPSQVAFYNACRATGFPDCPDHSNPESSGVGPSINNNHKGVRFSTSLGYLSQSRHRLNLTIRPNCMAQRVLFEGKRATGVVVESGGETFTVQGEQIILASGAVGSPQLLMLSGVGPAGLLHGLGIPLVQDLPGVGQNLRDHPIMCMSWGVKEGSLANQAAWGGATLHLTAPNSHLRNDLMIIMSAFVTERVNPMVPGRGGDSQVPLRIEMLVALALPLSSGELRVTSTDPNVQPFLDYNYLADAFDRQRLRSGVRQALELARHGELAEFIGARIEPTDADLASDDALDGWMMREVTTFSHICGTCKMGPASDPMAVVDQYGMVRGLEGLRVADASIMPDLVRAAINPTVLMIGERMVDLMEAGA